MALVSPFSPGFEPRIYVQAAKGQGFAEFEDVTKATRCLQYFQANQVQLKGSTLQFSFSTRQSVVTHEQLVQSLASSSRVLLVHVVNLMYPVTIEMLSQVFSHHGSVQKIVTFHKDQSVFQAMIQMSMPAEAASALQQLDSQNLFTGCNTLKIQYSTFGELTVKYNNAKTRDFTNVSLPSGPEPAKNFNTQLGAGVGASGYPDGLPAPLFPGAPAGGRGYDPYAYADPSQYGQYSEWGAQPQQQQLQQQQQQVIICYHLTPDRLSVDQLFNLFSLYGVVQRIKIMQNKPDCCLVQYTQPVFASLALQHLQGAQLYQQSLHLDFSKMREITIMPTGTDARTKQFSLQEQRYQDDSGSVLRNACKPTPVLLVQNISPEATERDLRAVLGPHGRMSAFRWVESGAGTLSALVNMESAAEATLALIFGHGAPLRERPLVITFSKTGMENGH